MNQDDQTDNGTNFSPEATESQSSPFASNSEVNQQSSVDQASPIVPAVEIEPTTAPLPPPNNPIPPRPDPQPGSGVQVQSVTKKPRNNRLVAVIIGLAGLVVVIGLILAYLLWWQNPQKVIADGVASIISAKTIGTNSDVAYEFDEGKITLKVTSANTEDIASAVVDLKLEPKDMDAINLKLEGLVLSNGVVYLKADGVKEAVEAAIREMSNNETALSSSLSDQSRMNEQDLKQLRKEQEAEAAQVLAIFDPIIKKIDSRWIKIDTRDMEDVDEEASKTQECLTKALNDFRGNDSMRREVVNAYKSNPFLIAKSDVKIDDYQGAKGYELDLGDKAKDNAKAFSRQLKDTELGRKLKDCGDSANPLADQGLDIENLPNSATESSRVLVWVTPFTHELKRIEIQSKNEEPQSGSYDLSIKSNIELNKDQSVDIPQDSISIKDLQKELEDIFKNMYAGPGYETQAEFDYSV